MSSISESQLNNEVSTLNDSNEEYGVRSTAKKIRAPGSRIVRVAQACDRCRAKKTKCDGGNPCSTCSAVGMKCIVSDKLSRKAFPKGYTETLEERVRHLEAENKKLTGLLDLRGEQLEILNTQARLSVASGAITTESTSHNTNNQASSLPNNTQGERITASNLHLLDQQNAMHLHMHDHENGCSCGCALPNAVHDRPVSVAGSLYGAGPVSIASSVRLSDDEYDYDHSGYNGHNFNDDDDDDDYDYDDDYNSLASVDDMPHRFAPNQKYEHKHEHEHEHEHGKVRIRNHFASNSTNKEASPAPGAFAAATAIAQMQMNKSFQQQQQKLERETNKQRMLTSLVATSMPRSTEETLCVPTLLARVCQAYGYDSQPSILAANTLASLKEQNGTVNLVSTDLDIQERLFKMIMNRDKISSLPDAEAIVFLRELIGFPVSRLDFDQLLTIYFQSWGNTLPILDKTHFLGNYVNVLHILEFEIIPSDLKKGSFELIEKVGALLVLALSLGFLANKNNYLVHDNANFYISLMKRYDHLIHEFIKPNCLITKICSIQSLQILSLALQYCLAIGDLSTCYELRGRVISMAQQLRLHRCPAAVLAVNTSNEGNFTLQNFMQAERRILFWCVYCLDTYSSLNLGVPRLMKDFEIECAMPFSGKHSDIDKEGDEVDLNNDNQNHNHNHIHNNNNNNNSNDDNDNDNDNVNILIINNTKLSIVGKVSRMALSVMLFCKVLANILDSIYSRFNHSDTLHKDRMLESWRRELPADFRFELDTNGLTLKLPENLHIDGQLWDHLTSQQLTLVYLYYHAKILIHLPIISKHGNHHNVGLSQKEQLMKGESDAASIVATMSVIQQSSHQILEVIKAYTKKVSSPILPIPINVAREQALLTLLVAKGTLDYIKGGHLYNSLKQLVLDSVAGLAGEAKFILPGTLTRNACKLLELTTLSILGVNLNKFQNGLKKKTTALGTPISKPAVKREPKLLRSKENVSLNFSGPKLVNDNSFNKNHNSNNTMKQEEVIISAINQPSTNSSAENQIGVNMELLDQTLNLDDMDSLESLLRFDPFSITPNNQMYMNEYVTDGSLGLVPFLEMPGPEVFDSNPNLEQTSFQNYSNL